VLTFPYPSSAHTMVAVGDGSGRFSAPSVPLDGLMPWQRDGAGNTLLTLGSAGASGTQASPVAVQPVGGGPVQPSPVPLPMTLLGPSLVGVAMTQPIGAGAVVAWTAGARLKLSTWRP